jgi:hypothetical protein
VEVESDREGAKSAKGREDKDERAVDIRRLRGIESAKSA